MQYLVKIRPRFTQSTLGETRDITDFVPQNGIGPIRIASDDSDFDFGTFLYDHVTLKLKNDRGLFSDPQDSRSIFGFSRDLSEVDIYFKFKNEEILFFTGVINDEATVISPQDSMITFKVLSPDSVLRTTFVDPALIDDGTNSTTAIIRLLNRPQIREFLNFNIQLIEPQLEFTIDDASFFDNITTQQALDSLMLATNSVLITDLDRNVIVRNRDDNQIGVHRFYGPGDVFGRENARLESYNTGQQRMFTTIKVNETVVRNELIGDLYGYREKSIDVDFVTDLATENMIASNIVDEFKAPKRELILKVPTESVRYMRIFDPSRLSYPFIRRAQDESGLPFAGATMPGEKKFPLISGAFEISEAYKFKVLSVEHEPSSFVTNIKLRESGRDLFDAVDEIENAV